MESVSIGKHSCNLSLYNDIAASPADTTVVPVPPDCPGKGGIYEAVRRAGAVAGCEALENWHAFSSDNMPVGSVLTVPSGGGSSTHLTHAATVCDYANGMRENFTAVVVGVESALEDIQRKGLNSVNLPLMGTGQLGWLTPEQSARAMAIGISRFANKHPEAPPLRLNFCIPNAEYRQVLETVLKQPELYTNIRDEAIRRETGKAVPAVADMELYRSSSPLAFSLNNTSKIGPNRPR